MTVKMYDSFVKEKEDQVVYLCRWNGNEIVEVHTNDSLFEKYKATNLYKGNREYENKLYNFGMMDQSFELCLEDYLDSSKFHDSYINQDFTLDNFTIRRIQ